MRERYHHIGNRQNIMPDEKVAEMRGLRNILNPQMEQEEKHIAIHAEQKRINILNNRDNSVREVRCKSRIVFLPSSQKLKRFREISEQKPQLIKGKIVDSKVLNMLMNLKHQQKNQVVEEKKEIKKRQNLDSSQEKQRRQKIKQQFLENSIRRKQYNRPHRIQQMRNVDVRRFQKIEQLQKNMRQ